MPSQIGIFVNGWAVSLNRTPNVTVLQTYTPAAELSDTGDFVTEFRSRENSRSTKSPKSKKTLFNSEHELLDDTCRGSIQSFEKSSNSRGKLNLL